MLNNLQDLGTHITARRIDKQAGRHYTLVTAAINNPPLTCLLCQLEWSI